MFKKNTSICQDSGIFVTGLSLDFKEQVNALAIWVCSLKLNFSSCNKRSHFGKALIDHLQLLMRENVGI